jgi:collagenase-like PrtC family protease
VLHTLEGRPFLSINGIQTLSYTCLNLSCELNELSASGISRFRISPQSTGTVAAAKSFHALLNKEITSTEASESFLECGIDAPFSNGFYHQQPGFEWRS